MTVLYTLDDTASRIPQARYILETLAALVGHPARFVADGAASRPDDVPVWVGDSRGREIEAAAVVEVRGWESWAPSEIQIAEFEGRPLPCPHGAVSRVDKHEAFPEEWLRSAGFLLGREEELADQRRDQWECFAGNYSRMHELGILDQPLVNAAARELGRRIESWCARRGLPAEPLARWKNGARFAVVLSHDVDDIRSASLAQSMRLLQRMSPLRPRALRVRARDIVSGFGSLGAKDDPYWRFEQWGGEEERRGFRSTWFVFPPYPAEPHEYDPLFQVEDPIRFEGRMQPFSSVLRALGARGFEVGLHASYRSHRSAERLSSEKGQIERATGLGVSGIRQHFLRFDLPRTWQAQEAAGFAYDSTLGYNEALGFRAGIAAPYRPWDPERRRASSLIELPLAVMDGTLFRTLGLDGPQAARRTIELLERVEEAEGLAVLLWHPHGADERRFPGWWSSYREVLAYLGGRSVWVATGSEMNAWWREREKAVLGG